MAAQAQMQAQMQMQMALQGGAGGGPPAQSSTPPGAEAGGPPAGQAELAPGQQQLPLEAAGMGGRRQAVSGALENQGKFDRVSKQEVLADLARVEPIRGRVFLTGAIARMGWTTGLINVGLTDMIDKATITQKSRYGREGRLIIEQVGEETRPNQAIVEVPVTQAA